MSTALSSVTDDAIAFLSERDQIALDEAADAQWEREQRIERAVTFDDLIEELAALDADKRAEFMECLARGDRHDAHWLHHLISEAKDAIVKRRLAQGD